LNTCKRSCNWVSATPDVSTVWDEQMENSPADKELGVLVGERLDMTQPWALPAQRAKSVLGCIRSPVGSRAREGILPLCSALVRPHLQGCIQLWGPYTGRTWTCWSESRGWTSN
ncbi:hypothetical protein HGM15179_003316, partial [Zosterops borbonicus]